MKEYRIKINQSSGEREEYSKTGSKADIAKPIKSYAIESNLCWSQFEHISLCSPRDEHYEEFSTSSFCEGLTPIGLKCSGSLFLMY
jgi:hypothetical protein